MKNIGVLTVLMLASCGKQFTEADCPKPYHGTCSWELDVNSIKDTVNKTDCSGWKQGKWRIRMYGSGQGHVIEKGTYLNNEKEGMWYRYNKKGELLDSLFYKNGVPK